jgi:hypothetical protein
VWIEYGKPLLAFLLLENVQTHLVQKRVAYRFKRRNGKKMTEICRYLGDLWTISNDGVHALLRNNHDEKLNLYPKSKVRNPPHQKSESPFHHWLIVPIYSSSVLILSGVTKYVLFI